MVHRESDERETQRPHVRNHVVRVPGLLDVSADSFKRQKRDFGKQSFRTPEVMRRGSRRHASALSRCA